MPLFCGDGGGRGFFFVLRADTGEMERLIRVDALRPDRAPVIPLYFIPPLYTRLYSLL